MALSARGIWISECGMWKKLILFTCLSLSIFAANAGTVTKVSQAAELMTVCSKSQEQCENILTLIKNNILFTAELAAIATERPNLIAELLEVPEASCALNVTASQLRLLIVENFKTMNMEMISKIGGDLMVFNALSVAAAMNCGSYD